MFPIFTLTCLQDKLLVGGGGGSTKAGVKNTLKLYNTESEVSVNFDQDAVMASTYHPLDKIIIAAVGNVVKVFKISSQLELLREIKVLITDEYEFIKKLVFSEDGNRLIVLVSDGSWLLYDWPSLNVLHNHLKSIENFDVNFIDDSYNFVVVTVDGTSIFTENGLVKSWEISNENLTFLNERCDFRGAKVISDKMYILLNAKSRKASYLGIYVNFKKSWKFSKYIKLANKPMTAYSVNQSLDLIAFGCSDLSLYIYRLDNLQCIKRIKEAHGFPVTCLDFNQDSTILASGSADGTIKLSVVPQKGRSYFLLLVLIVVLVLLWASTLINEPEL